MRPYTDAGTSSFLETVDAIGERLSREAVWHQGRCNWMGVEPVGQGRAPGGFGMAYRALGPEVYSGTSGVALFLAELHAVTGDVSARQTALGAIRQALKHADAVAPPIRLGLYTGWPGIAFAAARVGTLLGEEELLEQASQLLQLSSLEPQGEHEFDLLSGYAGAIAALVVLRDILDDASLLDFAAQLGGELLRSADETEAGYSWSSVAYPKQRNLTGFSHGTAGVGYALFELFRATDESRYLGVAEQAFQYERFWFDAAAGNWPDFREEPARGKRGKHPLSFATFWCHGAPGIALSRLRACEVLSDETCKEEAITALRTTRGATEAALRSGVGNFSLCHGLTGNAEVLVYGRQALGTEWADSSALAYEVANAGIETCVSRGLPWPCGTGIGGETPSLMLGLAGIGHFYLRLHDPTIPSVLMLRREDFSSNESKGVM
jgi:lantibiotic biosynthesis protein